jgi:hypothetical protein
MRRAPVRTGVRGPGGPESEERLLIPVKFSPADARRRQSGVVNITENTSDPAKDGLAGESAGPEPRHGNPPLRGAVHAPWPHGEEPWRAAADLPTAILPGGRRGFPSG